MFKEKKTAMVGTLVVALFLSSLTLTNPGKALAVSAFLKVDGVPGESTDDKHKDYIEVISWSFGDTQPTVAATSSGGARSAARVQMRDFRFNMRTNKASPMLFQACASGEHVKEVTLEVCKSDKDKQKFLAIKLTDVIVSSFISPGSSGTGSADLYPMEEIMLNFGKIDITYTQLDPQTGKPKGDIKASWDVINNKK